MIMTALRCLLGVVLLGLAGCAETPPSRFYLLTPVAAERVAGQETPLIGVGPVELPAYLDRPDIVTRAGDNRLNLAEFDRWAEPLEDGFTRVLAENLGVLIPTERIVIYPWERFVEVDYQVTVKVLRFDRAAGGDSVLSARWRLFDGSGRLLAVRRKTYRELPASSDYADTVAAMGGTVAMLSRDIVEVIAGLGS